MPEGRVAADVQLLVADATQAGDDAKEMLNISVRPRRQSYIKVVQPVKKSGGITNVIVTYRVEQTVKVDNTVRDKSADWLECRLSAIYT